MHREDSISWPGCYSYFHLGSSFPFLVTVSIFNQTILFCWYCSEDEILWSMFLFRLFKSIGRKMTTQPIRWLNMWTHSISSFQSHCCWTWLVHGAVRLFPSLNNLSPQSLSLFLRPNHSHFPTFCKIFLSLVTSNNHLHNKLPLWPI